MKQAHCSQKVGGSSMSKQPLMWGVTWSRVVERESGTRLPRSRSKRRGPATPRGKGKNKKKNIRG